MDSAGLGADPCQLAKVTTIQLDESWLPLCVTLCIGFLPSAKVVFLPKYYNSSDFTLEPFPR